MEPVLAMPLVIGILLSLLLIIELILLIKKKFYEKDKSGVCMVCGHNVQNLGGHIDVCLDRQIWKVK